MRKAGADSILVRCLLDQLLAGADFRSSAELAANYGSAAGRCGVPLNVVQDYVKQVGPAIFAPQLHVIHVTAFATSSGLTLVRIMGSGTRSVMIEEAASLVWTSAVMPASVRPQVSVVEQATNFDAINPAYLAGKALSVLVSTFGLGALLAWLLVRCRLRPSAATLIALTALVALAVWGAYEEGSLPPRELPLLSVNVIIAAIAYLPLKKWVSGKVRAPAERSA